MLAIHIISLALVTPPWFAKNQLPASQAAEAMRKIKEVPTVVVVDANNARGAVNFRFSKLGFSELVRHMVSIPRPLGCAFASCCHLCYRGVLKFQISGARFRDRRFWLGRSATETGRPCRIAIPTP
jgi:hypothetical protein